MDILVSGLMAYDWPWTSLGRFSDQLLATQKPRGPASLIPPAPSAGYYAPVGGWWTRSSVNSYVRSYDLHYPLPLPLCLARASEFARSSPCLYPYNQE